MATGALVLLLIVLAVVSLLWSSSRSESMIDAWAREQGITLVSAERSYFYRGPYMFWSDKKQTVYRVTVRTADGATRSGWVRCGGWIAGLWSDRVDVTRDD